MRHDLLTLALPDTKWRRVPERVGGHCEVDDTRCDVGKNDGFAVAMGLELERVFHEHR